MIESLSFEILQHVTNKLTYFECFNLGVCSKTLLLATLDSDNFWQSKLRTDFNGEYTYDQEDRQIDGTQTLKEFAYQVDRPTTYKEIYREYLTYHKTVLVNLSKAYDTDLEDGSRLSADFNSGSLSSFVKECNCIERCGMPKGVETVWKLIHSILIDVIRLVSNENEFVHALSQIRFIWKIEYKILLKASLIRMAVRCQNIHIIDRLLGKSNVEIYDTEVHEISNKSLFRRFNLITEELSSEKESNVDEKAGYREETKKINIKRYVIGIEIISVIRSKSFSSSQEMVYKALSLIRSSFDSYDFIRLGCAKRLASILRFFLVPKIVRGLGVHMVDVFFDQIYCGLWALTKKLEYVVAQAVYRHLLLSCNRSVDKLYDLLENPDLPVLDLDNIALFAKRYPIPAGMNRYRAIIYQYVREHPTAISEQGYEKLINMGSPSLDVKKFYDLKNPYPFGLSIIKSS